MAWTNPAREASLEARRAHMQQAIRNTRISSRWSGDKYVGQVPKGGFKATIPGEGAFSFQSQADQFPEAGPKGVAYVRGDMGQGKYVNVLLHRDETGKVTGILYHYPFNFPPLEQKGNVNVIVDPNHQRKGIGVALIREAGKRWNIDLSAQQWTKAGAALARAVTRG